MTRDSTALTICSLNSAASYCSFKDGKLQLLVYASDISVKDKNVTRKNKKPCLRLEETGLVRRM